MTHTIVIVDAATGNETHREMNELELEQHQKISAEFAEIEQAKLLAAQEAELLATQEAEAKAATKAAVLAKLGLTEEEINAFLA